MYLKLMVAQRFLYVGFVHNQQSVYVVVLQQMKVFEQYISAGKEEARKLSF